jgi:hypothetical protein
MRPAQCGLLRRAHFWEGTYGCSRRIGNGESKNSLVSLGSSGENLDLADLRCHLIYSFH